MSVVKNLFVNNSKEELSALKCDAAKPNLPALRTSTISKTAKVGRLSLDKGKSTQQQSAAVEKNCASDALHSPSNSKEHLKRKSSEDISSSYICFDSDSSLSPDFKPKKAKQQRLEDRKPGVKRSVDEKVDIRCPFCYIRLSSPQCLSRHRKLCAQNPERQPGLVCQSCGHEFHRRYIFNKHIKACKDRGKASSRFICSYPLCKAVFKHRIDLYDHLLKEHKANMTPVQTFSFDNEAKFKTWKAQVEDNSQSYFSQQYGMHRNEVFLYCQHDGLVKTHRKRGEQPRKSDRKNTKGVIKTNELCLSMMSVTYLDNGHVQVEYRPSHSHPCHPRDLPHHPLSDETNDFINRQLAWSVPPRKIWLSLRDDSYKRQNRYEKPNFVRNNVVNLKTLTERRRKLHAGGRFSEDDASAVYLKVQSLMQEPYNPILVYKPHGEELVTGPEGSEKLPLDVFLLAFQTKEQLRMMKEGALSIIAMDETHGTNSYDFKLLNIIVKDKFNLGYPVAHAISNRSDEHTYKFVIKAIRDRCPELSINCCITDDDPALINALEAGMETDVWHILCIWHIHRTVQANLRHHVKNSDLISEMYQVICVMIETDSEEELNHLVDAFFTEYEHKSPSFCKYFRDTFFPKAKKWAKCYRHADHGDVETTMLVESFHNVLKSVYLKRIPNRRLDDLLDLMLQIEEDYYTRYSNALNMERLPNKDLKDIKQRHVRGAQIATSHVLEEFPNHFKVKSQEKEETGVPVYYNVLKTADSCSSTPCIFVCPDLACKGLCSHIYQCSCPDFSPLCKHIHRVHMLQLDGRLPVANEQTHHTPLENPLFYTIENYAPENVGGSNCEHELDDKSESVKFVGANENLHANESSACVDVASMRRINIIRETLKCLDLDLERSPVKRHLLPRIQHTIKELHTQCEALTQDCNRPGNLPPEMKIKTAVAPNQKLQKQIKPFVKKKKKKHQSKLKRPNKQSVMEIKQFFVGNEENSDPDEPAENDFTESLKDCEEDSEENFLSVAENKIDVIVNHGWGLPVTYCTNPNDIILICNGIKLSLLHLKSLEENLSSQEVQILKRADEKFQCGWLYSDTIDAFMKSLETNNTVCACDTFVATGLMRGSLYKSLRAKIASKDVLLFPANLDGNHWVLAAVIVSKEVIYYYNPLIAQPETPLNSLERKLIESIATTMRSSYPGKSQWNVKRHFDDQRDFSSCGVFVCWVAYQLATNDKIDMLPDPASFRKAIYSILRLNCLRRNQFVDATCRVCKKPSEELKCHRCGQRYHFACVDDCAGFVCPI